MKKANRTKEKEQNTVIAVENERSSAKGGENLCKTYCNAISMICGNTEMPCSKCQIIVSKVTAAELRHQEQFSAIQEF